MGLVFIKPKKESQMATKEKGGFGGVPGGGGFEGQQIGGRGRTAFGSQDAARGRMNRLAGPYSKSAEVGAPVGRPGFREKTGGQGIVAFSPQYRASYPGSPVASAKPTTLRPRPGAAIAAPVVASPAAAAPIPKAKPPGLGTRTTTPAQTTKKAAAPSKETAYQRQQRIAREKDVLAPKSASRSQGATKSASRTTKTSTRTSQTPAQRAQAARRAERSGP